MSFGKASHRPNYVGQQLVAIGFLLASEMRSKIFQVGRLLYELLKCTA